MGSRKTRWDPIREKIARSSINYTIASYKPDIIISGGSPGGGVDAWAKAAAKKLKIPFMELKARSNNWAGFKARNQDIALLSSMVVCIVPGDTPDSIPGNAREELMNCYHCSGRNPSHVRSGGCYTAWRAKERKWIIC